MVDKKDKELNLDEETKDLKNWLHYQSVWALKMILMNQKNWLMILELIQGILKQVLAIKKVFNDLKNQ